LKGKVTGNTEEVAELTAEPTRIRKIRRQYCADAVIILGIIEASNIVVVGGFLLSVPNNLGGEPGSNALDQTQLVVNILIQLIGELVVCDGIAALVLVSFFPFTVVLGFTNYTCFTATLDDGGGGGGRGFDEDNALQICPLPVNITEMASVGNKFLDAFRNSTTGG